MLEPHIVSDPYLFGNASDRIECARFEESPAESSLALVTPKSVRLEITTSYSGKRQVRALFSLGITHYGLVVTDPKWKRRLAGLPIGASQTIHNAMITISLGEPFHGFCYKLVAAVIPLQQ